MFYDIFLQLCRQKGIAPSRAAEEIGINRANVSNWKNKGYTPRGKTLNDVAEYFGVPVDYLLSAHPAGPSGAPGQPAAQQPAAAQFGTQLFAAYGGIPQDFNNDDIEDIAEFMKMMRRRKAKDE